MYSSSWVVLPKGITKPTNVFEMDYSAVDQQHGGATTPWVCRNTGTTLVYSAQAI